MQNVRTTLLTTIILPLFLQVIQTETKVSSYDDLSCGTLLGDYRYCLDYSNKSLTKPPEGTNVTSILNLSNNKIKTIGEERFKSQRLLMKLDLSHNDISNIDPDALKHLKSLTEIKLGNNPYVCEASICSFRNWLFGNMHMVKDIKSVTCIGPVALRGQKIIELDADSVCSNGTIHHGFEINTGTVFMIWIVVPIMITTLTAFYIVLNGNNRFGRSVRSCFLICCQRTRPPIRAQRSPDRNINQDTPDAGSSPGRNSTRNHFSGSVYGEENLAPVENVERVEMEDVRPGPSNASSGSFW
ncbi:leucine-rich repeat-containing protein 52-like isoform X3 [Bolinopsis microptera]|uniref:leucine-rich repeat-containing protein 52-like isoform X3 n=1 Tax=Bolinopsis microptera TaxID=2820187 RepID=UPI0030796A94